MREVTGGFEDRFRVVRIDGKACRPEARYIVLDYATDEHAKAAVLAYADSVECDNKAFADDLRNAVSDPSVYPSQHF